MQGTTGLGLVLFNDLRRKPGAATPARRVLDRGWYVFGPELHAFEEEFAKYCGTAACVGVANGTDALELALRAAGVTPEDEVATVANAGMYATTAIRAVGAMPVYVDVSADGLMDPESLGQSLGHRTRAIVVTHLYGRMAPIEALLEAAARHGGIPVIEDCAQAHGAERAGQKAGTWGLAGCFSFYPTKNLGACGDAGAVITSDSCIASRVKALRQYGWCAKYESRLAGGRNSRLDEIQAAVLRDRLPLLDSWNQRRREIARRYTDAFGSRFAGMASTWGEDTVAHLYVIRCAQRKHLREWLAAAGIQTEIHYPIPDHLQSSQQDLPSRFGRLPMTARLADEVLSLPCFPELNDDEIEAVIQCIHEWRP